MSKDQTRKDKDQSQSANDATSRTPHRASGDVDPEDRKLEEHRLGRVEGADISESGKE